MLNQKRKRFLLKSSLAALVGLGVAGQAHSANWLMLQGTENPKAPKHRMWGFIQPQYSHNKAPKISGLDHSDFLENAEGLTVGNNLVGPMLEDESALHLKRARIGWRGKINDKINYFTLFEAGQNAFTYDPLGDRDILIAPTDLSLTFNHLPGAKIRIGLFKNPGSEETFQGIGAFDFHELTDFQNRINLERFVTGGQKLSASGGMPDMGTATSTGYGVSGFRDWGIQVFDHKKMGNWDMSYAVKVGRGEAILSSKDPDFHPELYLYLSGEYDLPGGKGGKKNGVKLYAWHQQGERSFESDDTDTKFDRIRQGIGIKAVGKLFDFGFKHRVAAEYMQADGMLFIAPQRNVPEPDSNIQYAAEKGNKARGFQIEYGFSPTKQWQFDFRYDQNDLLYKSNANVENGNEREIKGWTYGVTYYIKPKQKISLNYIHRKADNPVAYADNTSLTDDITKIVANLDDKITLQYYHQF